MTACETVVQHSSLAVLDFYSKQERKHMWSVCVGGGHCKTHTECMLNTKSIKYKISNINKEITLFHLKKKKKSPKKQLFELYRNNKQ